MSFLRKILLLLLLVTPKKYKNYHSILSVISSEPTIVNLSLIQDRFKSSNLIVTSKFKFNLRSSGAPFSSTEATENLLKKLIELFIDDSIHCSTLSLLIIS